MAGYRDRFAELTSLGFGLAAVSVDVPERSRALTSQLQLPFLLLSDSAREVVQSYDLLNRPMYPRERASCPRRATG